MINYLILFNSFIYLILFSIFLFSIFFFFLGGGGGGGGIYFFAVGKTYLWSKNMRSDV